MESQYYYSELMASYLAKRKCDDSFVKYLFGKGAVRKTPEELERADERKRRLQRERSRRYRALKNARRRTELPNDDARRDLFNKFTYELCAEDESRSHRAVSELGRDNGDSSSGNDEPPTLCKITEDFHDGKLKQSRLSSCSESASDENSTHSFLEAKEAHLSRKISMSLKDFLSIPNHELDYSTVHSLMFHWLQT